MLVVSPNDTGIRQARAKTDRLDARTIAKLLASGSLEGLWMPDRPTRALQRRRQLVRARTRAKNEVHAALMRRLIAKPAVSDLFGREGRRWLGELELPAEERETVDSCLRQIDFLESELAEADRVIAQDALGSAEVRRLMSVPGVNVITAASFMAAIGEIGRFPTRRRLVGYLGLDPRVRRSGSTPAAHGRSQSRAPRRPAMRWSRPRGRWCASRGRCTPSTGGWGTARPPGGDRRRRPQTRLPVLVPSHPRGGLRLRAAIADPQEAAPARAGGRGAEGQGGARALGDERGDARRGARARPAGGGRL
ncbi:MAG: transposase [Solirubrobacterales bacterium]